MSSPSNGVVAIFDEDDLRPPAGHPERFGGRWRLVGIGLSDVWRYGDLVLPARSGRLLLRGPNGTGKTTALEALWPFLLDLNAQRLSAGKARTTTLRSLMREGASGKRRVGYLWLTFAGPGSVGEWSYGVRLHYSESTPVKVIPFTVPGRPLRDIDLHGPGRASLNLDEFTETITAAGGQVFDDDDAYIANLAARVWSARPQDVRDLATRLRVVRNPSLLGDLSPAMAADALRDALPTVHDDVITATADALAESDATREAFNRDARAADVLREFADTWTGHVTAVIGDAHQAAEQAQGDVGRARQELRRLEAPASQAREAAAAAEAAAQQVRDDLRDAQARAGVLEKSQAFRAAQDLAGLHSAMNDKQCIADSELTGLRGLADHERERMRRLTDDLSELRGELDDLTREAVDADPSAGPTGALLTWASKPRAVLRVGDEALDPGPRVTAGCDLDQVRDLGQRWSDAGTRHRTRAHDAQLAINDHDRNVTPADQERDRADRDHRAAISEADKAQQMRQRTAATARAAASDVCGDMIAWLTKPQVATLIDDQADPGAADDQVAGRITPGDGPDESADPDPADATGGWGVADVDELSSAEPSQVLELLDTWRHATTQRSERRQATLHNQASQHRASAQELDRDAGVRRGQAQELRSGQLLPLPRPGWLADLNAQRARRPEGQAVPLVTPDSELFGSILDWRANAATATEQALLESALAASGLLGAAIDADGLQTLDWSVSAAALALDESGTLAAVLTVDADHSLAATAAAVLTRIPLLATAPGAEATTGLVIGRDGTFTIGPASGRAPGAGHPGELPPATHIGARQRRAAAFLHADRLEQEATELTAAADEHRSDAVRLANVAKEVRAAATAFPPLRRLRDAEAVRSLTAQTAHEAGQILIEKAEAAAEAAEHARNARQQWAERTRARGLPTTPDELASTRDAANRVAQTLTTQSQRILGRFLTRLARALPAAGPATDRGHVESLPADLSAALTKATTAHDEAARAVVEYRTLQESAGADAQAAVEAHQAALARVRSLQAREEPTRRAATEKAQDVAGLDARLEAARQRVDDAQPAADAARAALICLLEVPGVSQALEPTRRIGDAQPPQPQPAPGDDGRPAVPVSASWWSADPLRAVAAALTGRRPVPRRTLRERYDQARAALAGNWTLDPGDSLHDLDTYVLTHDDVSYHPLVAAGRAQILKDRAIAALEAAEEQALRDFIIGRLPSAIGLAWTRTHDWANTVNKKMRAAAASSGVGVQVRVRLSDDLSPAAHTVYQLSCTVADADRSDIQKRDVGAALTQLIAAADGETMHERIAEAVDVRRWVDIHYEIDRGTGKTERWGGKTALSGGERRLVILAPMLAAVAAGYDSLGPHSLRLAALDEVPAEVDERGREGLARYIAELDLDLISTSYLWDGAPGAWDGIDAYDLESGSDGTVVAFEMLVRGLTALPGDDDSVVGTAPLGTDPVE